MEYNKLLLNYSNNILTLLDEFMNSSNRNAWLNDDILKIYVRKGIQNIDSKLVYTLDIANISSINPLYKSKGYFKAFMIHAESYKLPIFVENIHNPKLVQMLIKNGYLKVERYGNIHCIKYTT